MIKSNAREGEILSSHAAMESNPHNLDRATVDDFGREWQRFDQSSVSSGEVRRRFAEYFALFPWDSLPRNAVGFDAGCGSGRWAALVAPRPLLFSNAEKDTWANPWGQFDVLLAAEPVYVLLGASGLGTKAFPHPGELVGGMG